MFLTARGEEVDRIVGLELRRGRLRRQAVQPARAGRACEGRPAAAKREVETTEEVAIRDLRLDPRGLRMSASVAAPVELSALEFKLLYFLSRPPPADLQPRATA